MNSVLIHPNIVGYRGLPSTKDGRTTLAMESCDTSLGDILENRKDQDLGPLPAESIMKVYKVNNNFLNCYFTVILQVCADIFNALNYLHTDALILHGDMKSYNILIKQQFSICKLCDFGVSLPLTADGFVDLIKKPDAQYIGTNLWSAPEVLIEDNTANISSKADIFSFGMVIYECIALIAPHMWALLNDEEGDESIINLDDSDVAKESDSLNQTDQSMTDIDLLVGTRPPLPESDNLPDTYNVPVELFYVCTNPTPESRPTAACLINMLKQSKVSK